MSFTIKQLEELQAKKKIRGFSETVCKKGKKHSANEPKNIPDETKVSKRKGQKIKEWILLHLEHWCEANRLELWHAGNERGEFMFDPERIWRFDFSVPKKKWAFEYEGIHCKKSRHTTAAGYTGDTDKYSEAALQGWKVLRYTAQNYKQLINDLNRLI